MRGHFPNPQTAPAATGWVRVGCSCGHRFEVLSLIAGSVVPCPRCRAPVAAIPLPPGALEVPLPGLGRPPYQASTILGVLPACVLIAGTLPLFTLLARIGQAGRDLAYTDAGLLVGLAGTFALVRAALAGTYLFRGSDVARKALLASLGLGLFVLLMLTFAYGAPVVPFLSLEFVLLTGLALPPAGRHTPGVTLPWAAVVASLGVAVAAGLAGAIATYATAGRVLHQ